MITGNPGAVWPCIIWENKPDLRMAVAERCDEKFVSLTLAGYTIAHITEWYNTFKAV